MTSHVKTCRDCGADLEGGAAEGLCPACLLKAGLAAPGSQTSPTILDGARSADHGARAAEPSSLPLPAPRFLGDYELVEEVARGGMGVVYRARQISLKRSVALKMILSGPWASEVERRRFRAEAEAAAQLQHPNIVAIHEVGEHEGQPYFSMDYVQGRSLAVLCQQMPINAEQAARYLGKVAGAIHYAHEKGILHRDLKPSNVLIDGDDQPRVTDFGLAKNLQETNGVTLSGAVMGSPSYMPPEQASGQTSEMGPHSDVYSLGAILYHLVTGRPPFQAATPVETLRQVIDFEPAAPGRVNPTVPADLQTITLKCLEKDPKRRYASAQLLAEDLARYLRQEPISARKITPWERTQKWMKRRPAIAALTLLAAGLLFLVIIAAGLGYSQTKRALGQSTWHLYLAEMKLAHQAALAGEDGRLRTLLNKWLPARNEPDRRGWEWSYLRALGRNIASRAGPVPADGLLERINRMGRSPLPDPRDSRIESVAWSPEGDRLAFLHSSGTVQIWDSFLARVEAEFPGRNSRGNSSLVWSPSGDYLAYGVIEMRYLPPGAPASNTRVLRLAEVASGKVKFNLLGHPEQVESISWDPNGKWIASSSLDGTVILWDSTTGQAKASLPGRVKGRNALAFSPDGNHLAMAGEKGAVEIWDAHLTAKSLEIQAHEETVLALAWDSTGQRLATAVRQIKIWDVHTRQAVRSLDLPDNRKLYWSIDWSHDDSWIAAGRSDGIIEAWLLEGQAQPVHLNGHSDAVDSLSWHPKRPLLASGSWDNHVKLWDLSPRRANRRYRVSGQSLAAVEWNPNTGLVAVAGRDGAIRLVNAETGQVAQELRKGTHSINALQWSSQGGLLASGSSDGLVNIWRGGDGEWIQTLEGKGAVAAVAWNPEGDELAVCRYEAMEIQVWDVRAGRERFKLSGHQDRVLALAWSPDGTHLASCGLDLTARLWSMETGQEERALRWHQSMVRSLAWSPDSRRLATASADRTLKVWNSLNGQEQIKLAGHNGAVNAVSWSPDAQRIASASQDGTVKLWDTLLGHETLSLSASGAHVNAVAWSADGKRLAAVDDRGLLHVWDAEGHSPDAPRFRAF